MKALAVRSSQRRGQRGGEEAGDSKLRGPRLTYDPAHAAPLLLSHDLEFFYVVAPQHHPKAQNGA
jgi:hypothetical protein